MNKHFKFISMVLTLVFCFSAIAFGQRTTGNIEGTIADPSGANVPNATVIIIEHADRFGLAQLHQLRGRVGRAEHQSYCYLFSETENDKTLERLNNFAKTSSGFDLAEIDLRERGAGALLSTKQSGMSDMAMQALRNLKLVELAKKYAKEIIDNDPDLENFVEIRDQLAKYENSHLE